MARRRSYRGSSYSRRRRRRGTNTVIPGLSFSWRRALGVTAAKQRFARATGIPTTRSGRQQKIGRMMGCLIPVISALLIASLLISLIATAFAEEYAYIQYGDAGFPIGKVSEYMGISCNYNADAEPVFDDELLKNLNDFQTKNGLSPANYFDNVTLENILDVKSHSLNMVWIPMHGGKKYHKVADCSNMHEPRQMPVDCAKALGFEFCKRCVP